MYDTTQTVLVFLDDKIQPPMDSDDDVYTYMTSKKPTARKVIFKDHIEEAGLPMTFRLHRLFDPLLQTHD